MTQNNAQKIIELPNKMGAMVFPADSKESLLELRASAEIETKNKETMLELLDQLGKEKFNGTLWFRNGGGIILLYCEKGEIKALETPAGMIKSERVNETVYYALKNYSYFGFDGRSNYKYTSQISVSLETVVYSLKKVFEIDKLKEAVE